MKTCVSMVRLKAFPRCCSSITFLSKCQIVFSWLKYVGKSPAQCFETNKKVKQLLVNCSVEPSPQTRETIFCSCFQLFCFNAQQLRNSFNFINLGCDLVRNLPNQVLEKLIYYDKFTDHRKHRFTYNIILEVKNFYIR